MPDTQHYSAEIHVRIPGASDLATIYHDMTGPVGMSDSEVRAAGEKVARAEIPHGTVVGSRVTTDGVPR